MTEKEFDELITDKDITNAKVKLVLEAREYRNLMHACNEIAVAIREAAKDLDTLSNHLEYMALNLVNAKNTDRAEKISNVAASYRHNIEDALRFKAEEDASYINDLEYHIDNLRDNDGGEWGLFPKEALDSLKLEGGFPLSTDEVLMEDLKSPKTKSSHSGSIINKIKTRGNKNGK